MRKHRIGKTCEVAQDNKYKGETWDIKYTIEKKRTKNSIQAAQTGRTREVKQDRKYTKFGS